MHACIIELAGVLRKISAASFNNLGIHLDQVDTLNALISRKFLNYAAVSCADDKDILNIGMNRHRNMRDHLIVNELIALCKHYVSIQSKDLAEFRSIENIDLLVITLA